MSKVYKSSKRAAVLALAAAASLTLFGCSDVEASDENQKTAEEVDKMMDANVEERHKQHLEFAQRYQKIIDDAQTSGVIRNIWPDQNLKQKCGEVDADFEKYNNMPSGVNIPQYSGQLTGEARRKKRIDEARVLVRADAIRCHAAAEGIKLNFLPVDLMSEQSGGVMTADQALEMQSQYLDQVQTALANYDSITLKKNLPFDAVCQKFNPQAAQLGGITNPDDVQTVNKLTKQAEVDKLLGLLYDRCVASTNKYKSHITGALEVHDKHAHGRNHKHSHHTLGLDDHSEDAVSDAEHSRAIPEHTEVF